MDLISKMDPLSVKHIEKGGLCIGAYDSSIIVNCTGFRFF